jgi:hypothetical protein
VREVQVFVPEVWDLERLVLGRSKRCMPLPLSAKQREEGGVRSPKAVESGSHQSTGRGFNSGGMQVAT